MSYLFVFILGLIIGSFLNVCIYRIPRGESIINPPSHCPSCNKKIRFYDNIPIISYVMLGGRCRSCGERISLRYPLVELVNGTLYILIYSKFLMHKPWVVSVYFIFASALIVIFFIDLDYQIIPDEITLPGMIIGLIVGSTFLPDPFLRGELLGFISSIIGFISGGLSFYLIAVAGRIIFRKEAMGGGDIKMMAMVGAFLGWKGVILTTFAGSLIGSISGITMILLKGQEWGARIPFGPYLATGAIITLLFGEEIIRYWMWYLNAV